MEIPARRERRHVRMCLPTDNNDKECKVTMSSTGPHLADERAKLWEQKELHDMLFYKGPKTTTASIIKASHEHSSALVEVKAMTRESSNHPSSMPRCKHFYMNELHEDHSLMHPFDSNLLESYARYLPEDACHGDLVVIGAKRLRSSNVYIVHKQPTSGADSAMRLIYGQLSMPTTTASSTTTTTKTAPTSKSNQCCVPLEVSMHMSEPLAFYADAFHFATYDDVDFLGIELDPLLHGERVVSRFTHLPVAANRRLVYLLDNNEWDSRAGLFIWCDFYLDDFAAGRFVRLDERTDGELVTARPRMQRDPHIVAEYAATKHAYEQDFTGMLLAMRPGTEVDVYGLSFFCQKLPKHKHEEEEEEKATTSQERKNKDSDGENDDDDDDDDDEEGSNNGSIFVMVFNRVEWEETSDEPAAIVLNKLEYETVSVNEMSKVLDTNEEFVFVRKVLTPYGKFGNVRLWCAEHVSVIANEKARTYVICSADLFM